MYISTIGIFADTEGLSRKLERILKATDYPVQRSEGDWVTGFFYNCQLSSVFQPIFDTTENKTIGHVAYTRSELNEQATSAPWNTFALSSEENQLAKLDRLCRIIHALNYFNRTSDQNNKLFVHVQPRLLESVKDDHGQAFEHVLNLIEVPTSRVVIELPHETNHDWKFLRKVIQNYRSRGYQIATNFSSESNDWMLELMMELSGLYPDIMRIQIRDLLRHNAAAPLIKTIHRFNTTVLVYDIETADQATEAVHAGVDYLQGNFLSKPTRDIYTISPQLIKENKEDLASDYFYKRTHNGLKDGYIKSR
ncbi:EAL domain-containing protein [Nitrosomonas sp. Is37]|uniref:EAL domain-containing protein n=1 Tax=Nitrosomonas sp. Is37 TaxID=3080535 RepID=UPI00294AFE2F|nr:EAL domain-containing protein [Nitrosomonas sp. Is37]MDV6343316.1 EAL domain-containing protein [Nitrosomonas sp. Is37]